MADAIKNHSNDKIHLDSGRRVLGRSSWRGVGSAIAACGREIEMWHPVEWDPLSPDACGTCKKRAGLLASAIAHPAQIDAEPGQGRENGAGVGDDSHPRDSSRETGI